MARRRYVPVLQRRNFKVEDLPHGGFVVKDKDGRNLLMVFDKRDGITISKILNSHDRLIEVLKFALKVREIDGDKAAISVLLSDGRAAIKSAEEDI